MLDKKKSKRHVSEGKKSSSVKKEVGECPSAYKSSKSEKAEKPHLHSLIFAKIFNHLLQPTLTINFLDMAKTF